MSALALARPSPAAQFTSLTRQSLRRAMHDPSALVVPVVFPLAVLAINVAALKAAASLPGFPTTDIVNFAIGLTFLQGTLFAAIPAATDLAVDIESGFLDRLAMTPVAAGVLIAARMAAVLAMGLGRCACFLLVVLAAGGSMSVGPGGVAVLGSLQTAGRPRARERRLLRRPAQPLGGGRAEPLPDLLRAAAAVLRADAA